MPSPAARAPGGMPPKKAASAVGGKALIGLACLAVGLVVGYGAGRVSPGTPTNPLAPNGQQPVTQAPGDPLALNPNGPPPLESSTSLSGTAVAATASRLTFDAETRPFDPSGQKGLPVRRTANISSSTVIVRLVEKTPQELSADQQAFAEASAAGSEGTPPPPPPSGYKEVPISATDISAGEMVTVMAANDIVSAETFDAVQIVVAPKLAAPPAAQAPSPAPQPDSAPPAP